MYDYRSLVNQIVKGGCKIRTAKQLRAMNDEAQKAYNDVVNGSHYTYFRESVEDQLNDGAVISCSEQNFKAIYAELRANMVHSEPSEHERAYEMMVDLIVKKSNRILFDRKTQEMRSESQHKTVMEGRISRLLNSGLSSLSRENELRLMRYLYDQGVILA